MEINLFSFPYISHFNAFQEIFIAPNPFLDHGSRVGPILRIKLVLVAFKTAMGIGYPFLMILDLLSRLSLLSLVDHTVMRGRSGLAAAYCRLPLTARIRNYFEEKIQNVEQRHLMTL